MAHEDDDDDDALLQSRKEPRTGERDSGRADGDCTMATRASATPEEDLALLTAVSEVMRELTKHRSSFVPSKTLACDIVLDERGRVKMATGLMSFTVAENMLNAGGNLFGGYVPALTDSMTTRVLFSCNLRTEGTWVPSMSTALDTEFLDGVGLGKEVFVEVHVNRIGKSVAFTDADFYRGHPSNGALLYKARHQVVLSRDSPAMANRVRERCPEAIAKVEAALASYETAAQRARSQRKTQQQDGEQVQARL